MYFNIALCGVTIAVKSLYDEVFELCRPYLVSTDKAAFCVETTPADIAFERDKAIREAFAERRAPSVLPDAYLETLAVYRKIARRMLSYDVVLMHGSAVAVGNDAYLFCANSGTGKTTHSRLWLENIPGAFIVNGDKPLISVKDEGCAVSGTPWAGKEGWNTNVTVPLRAICLLERGEKNNIREVSFREIYTALFEQIYRPSDKEEMIRTLELMKTLSKTMRFYRLSCNMDPEAAQVSYEGMRP